MKTGEIRESGETGDTREEEDTQWRQVSTLYTRILRTVADSAYFVISYMKYNYSNRFYCGNFQRGGAPPCFSENTDF